MTPDTYIALAFAAAALLVAVIAHRQKRERRYRRIWEFWDCTCWSDPLGRCVVHEGKRRA